VYVSPIVFMNLKMKKKIQKKKLFFSVCYKDAVYYEETILTRLL